MCDPFTFGAVGLVGAVLMNSNKKKGSSAAPVEPEDTVAQERARAEAEAAQRANAQLAQDQRRRREQQSLLSTGAAAKPPAAPAPTFGDDDGSDLGGSPLNSGRMTSRSSVARQSSLLARGGEAIAYGGGGLGGGNSRTRNQLQ
jgi:hypothetical protein